MNLLTKSKWFRWEESDLAGTGHHRGRLFRPGAFSWSVHYTVWLLGVVMFGMGMTPARF